MPVDMESVISQPTYRIGFLPPDVCSLKPGELYVEVAPAGGGVPRLWVGTIPEAGFPGNNTLLVPGVQPFTPSVIDIDPIDNPSVATSVHIAGTVDPGTVIEFAAMQGTNPEYLVQTTAWSPWDATTDGVFDVVWYIAPGDDLRIRVRMRNQPWVFADSNLFAVTEAPPA